MFIMIQWFEVLDGLLGKHWRNVGLFFNCTFLLFGSVIQLIACARLDIKGEKKMIFAFHQKKKKRYEWFYI